MNKGKKEKHYNLYDSEFFEIEVNGEKQRLTIYGLILNDFEKQQAKKFYGKNVDFDFICNFSIDKVEVGVAGGCYWDELLTNIIYDDNARYCGADIFTNGMYEELPLEWQQYFDNLVNGGAGNDN